MAGQADFRKSQGVVPFGVGAIIDFPDQSLMTAGLDVWPYEGADGELRIKILDETQIIDGRLARRLTADLGHKIKFFLSPIEAPDAANYGASSAAQGKGLMPFVRFPSWYFCPRCRVMNVVPWNTQINDSKRLKCSNPSRIFEGKGKTCDALIERSRPLLSPVRFVVACENGHIMDFPWVKWVHIQKKIEPCDGKDGDLYIYSSSNAGLAGVMIQCVKCKSKRSMAGAFRRNALAKIFQDGCPGERPWLGPNAAENGCGQIPQTIQRGASNAYFARVVSSILIPPYSALLQQTLDRPDLWDEIRSLPLVDGKLPEPFLRQKARSLGFEPDLFIKAVEERFSKDT